MVNKYIDYFRQLAVRHKDIRHNQAAESNQRPATEKHFTTWSADEAVTGIKTAIGYPALFLELFELDTTGDNPHAVKGGYRGALSLFDRIKSQDFADQTRKSDRCYRILEEMLREIWQDHYGTGKDSCNSPFSQFMFNDLNIVYAGPLFDGNVYGWRCEFSFKPRNVLDLTTPPPEGTFTTPNP